MKQHRAKAQVQNVWNIRVQVLFVEKHSYPYLDGNIPETLSYGIFISQLIRFCSINSTFIGFHKDVKSLVVKLCKQGFKLAALRNRFYKFYKCKINLWGKYGVDIYDKMIKIFDE